MRILVLASLALSLAIIGCKQAAPNTSAEAVAATEDGKYESYGEVITTDGAIAYPALVAKVQTEGGFEGKVQGTVESVCQAKGCWINITEAGVEQEMFVKFKDYGFFLPKDCSGKQVILRGKAYEEETSVEELQHYAEDEGASAEDIAAITEPKKELKFMADGVLLMP
jgi:hypothetical protein